MKIKEEDLPTSLHTLWQVNGQTLMKIQNEKRNSKLLQVSGVRRARLLGLVIWQMQRQLFLENSARNGPRKGPISRNTTIVEIQMRTENLKFGVSQLIQKLNGRTVLFLFALLEMKMLNN